MSFGENILNYKDDILKDLKALMEIKSVSSDTESCKKALEYVLNRATEMGFETKNIDNVAGHIQYGNGGKLCGVLSHLDVVPAGDNWDYEPFTLTEAEGRLFGRGVADDKGASIINLYCLKALKDNGVEINNTIRCIFGTNEETGMTDMETYFSKEPVPDMSFTPDSDYGICFAEKGIMQIKIFMDRNDGKILSAVKSGNTLNAVPDYAEELLYSSDSDEYAILEKVKKYDLYFDFKETIDGLVITSKGTATHACHPELGKNAVMYLCQLLGEYYDEEDLGTLCTFINNSIGEYTDGTLLGIKTHDSISKDLTCTLSKVRINDNRAELVIDIRYPVSVKGEKIFKDIKKCASRRNLHAEILFHEKPLYVPRDSEIIKVLSKSYEEIMGEKPDIYSTGGGTYAKTLGGKGVAFGLAFKDDNTNMHNANESIDKDKFFKHGEICLQSIYEMATGNFD